MTSVTPEFVEYIPADGKNLVPGVVYISMKHRMVVHRCACGCGQLSEFMLDPIRFRMAYDGESVSFHPSIGNSNLRCRSHYWIRRNRIEWHAPMDDRTIDRAAAREFARAVEKRHAGWDDRRARIEGFWRRLARRLRG